MAIRLAVGMTALAVLLLAASGSRPAHPALADGDSATFDAVVCVDTSCGQDAYGLEVIALINGVDCGHGVTGPHGFVWTTDVWSGVVMEIAAASEKPGCGVRDAPIQFTVGGRPAHETYYTWDDRGIGGALSVGDAAVIVQGSLNDGEDPMLYPCDDLCDGPLVEAFVNGTHCGELQTRGNKSTNGFIFLVIAGDELRPGCAGEGDIVTFTVGGRPAHETFVFAPGPSYGLGLTVGVVYSYSYFSGHACVDADCSQANYNKPVVAKIGDVVCGSSYLNKPYTDGQEQSYYQISVAPAEKTPGCGTEGATVDFYIDGRKTAQSGSWSDGSQPDLDIWVGPDFAAFEGMTTCDGKPCYICFEPCQTVNVKAYIGAVKCGEMSPYGWLLVGGYGPLIVKSADDQRGCGTLGATVTFTINGKPTGETAVWQTGFARQNLTVGDMIWGDTDCSGEIGGPDALQILKRVVSPYAYGPCYQVGTTLNLSPLARQAQWGDIDCSGEVTIPDAIKTLYAGVGLTFEQGAGCPAPGTVLQPYKSP